MAAPDLSGILNDATKVTQTNTSSTTSAKVIQKPLFEIDQYGNIDIESMKGSKYYDIAKSYDKNGDNVLKLYEIRNFLNDKTIKENDVETKYYRNVYYQEKDSAGNITKRAYYGKGDKGQYVFTYSNGKAVSCNVLLPHGTTYNYDLKNERVKIGSINSKQTSETTIIPNVKHKYEEIGKNLYGEKYEPSIIDRIINWFNNFHL